MILMATVYLIKVDIYNPWVLLINMSISCVYLTSWGMLIA